jgi:hypothetical protein
VPLVSNGDGIDQFHTGLCGRSVSSAARGHASLQSRRVRLQEVSQL